MHELIISKTIRINSSMIAKSWIKFFSGNVLCSYSSIEELSASTFFINFIRFLDNKLNKLLNRWQTYGCKLTNLDDMFANAAKQFVCKYLSLKGQRQN
jgi:hypothetical protein